MEAIEQTFNGTEGFGQSVTATVSRNGDLIHRMYLEHDVQLSGGGDADDGGPALLAIFNNYGNRLMKDVELEIGGQRIDRHYGHWMSTWSELSEFNPTGNVKTLFNKMSGNGSGCLVNGAGNSAAGDNETSGEETTTGTSWETTPALDNDDVASTKIFVPLQFWFCRNPGLALPLIALQYHEVKVKITFEKLVNLARKGANFAGLLTPPVEDSSSFKLFADYIYLDTDERRRFAQVSHEYLIEQVQHATYTDGGSMTLNFNHPVKELVWSVPDVIPATSTNSLLTNSSDVEGTGSKSINTSITSGTWILKLNGHDRFSERDTKYFTRAQVWQHHTGGSVGRADKIGVYSFALKPEEHQPSGTCNFSRIDNAQLVTSITDLDFHVYAVNYNVLRIMSGMGGLAYSN
tara:strand:- start:449 stop:1663 length:1215 start_codon:yes stop_codon:yes gene_type:complete